MFLSDLPAEPDPVEWITVTCANDGCDNLATALTQVANHGQGELFPEFEPVICDGCLDVMADQHEAEFGWMREF